MSIISCIIHRLKRDEQTDTYVHFEQTATLRKIATAIDTHKPQEPSCFTRIITRNKMDSQQHTRRLIINREASGTILTSDQYFYSEQMR